MSNLLYMDESNGNGVYAHKLNTNTNTNTNTTNTATTITNNLNNIMNATATSSSSTTSPTAMATSSTTTTTSTATATAIGTQLPTSVSNEDLSQSLSEYTDADESISAPTEFLAEFLSAVMLKDYKKALKYCKLILQYEPNNSTAQEFYPLILDKLRGATSSDSDENYNKSSSPELMHDLQCSDPSAGESDEAGSDEPPHPHMDIGVDDYAVDDYGAQEDNSSGEPQSHGSNSNNRSNSSEGLSLSESIESDDDDDDDDDGDGDENVVGDEDDDVDVDDDDDDEEEEDVLSSSGDDLPVDEPLHNVPVAHIACNLDQCDGGGSGSHSSRNSSSGGGGRSRSDNTTHSYSSLLLEEDDDMVPANLQFTTNASSTTDLDVSNGNKLPSASCSDSESPTEPLTQRLAAILLSKCGVSNSDGNY